MSEMLSDHLRRSQLVRGRVTREEFEDSKTHLSRFASWAVWGAETSDPSVFDEPRIWERLRKDVFLVGGNTGLFKGGRPAHFSNFHTKGHGGDTKLMRAIRGTALEGAYLTDVVKDYPTKDSGALVRDIKLGKVALQTHVIGHLQQELDLLGAPADLVLVLMGKGTATVWDTVAGHPDFPSDLVSNFKVVRGISHYTSRTDFAEEIRRVLQASWPASSSRESVHG